MDFDSSRWLSQRAWYISSTTVLLPNIQLSLSALAQEFVEEAVKLLLTKYIPLKPSDLEGWMEDPEEWINSEEKDNTQWEFELRVCFIRLLLVLKVLMVDISHAPNEFS